MITLFFGLSQNCKSIDKFPIGKVYFHIPKDLPRIIVPTIINDSIQADLTFDSAGTLWLDSTFCVQNKIKFDNKIAYPGGVAWSTSRTPFHFSNTPISLSLGEHHIIYKRSEIADWKRYMGQYQAVGMFDTPIDDTTHVWEINFEKEYLQIHPSSSFRAPEGTTFFPMEADGERFLITIPITAKFSDGSVIKGRWKGLIDTGAHQDIVLVNGAPEINILKKRNDAIWTITPNGYNRWNEVSATVFDKYKLDSLRLYTVQNRVTIDANYVIGINFLKHFNVFLDLKNKRLGLQPLEHFIRITDPLARRYHAHLNPLKNGRFVIDHIPNYESNYLKKAGLKVGDEIISINGIKYGSITDNDRTKMQSSDILKYKIRRQGKIKEIIVHVNKNEKQGD